MQGLSYFYDTKKISRSQTGISNKDFFIFYFRNNHPKSSPFISQISHFILLSYTIIYHLIYFLISYLILSCSIRQHRVPLGQHMGIKVRIPPSPRLTVLGNPRVFFFITCSYITSYFVNFIALIIEKNLSFSKIVTQKFT